MADKKKFEVDTEVTPNQAEKSPAQAAQIEFEAKKDALVVTPPQSTKEIIREMMQELMPGMMALMQGAMMATRPVDPRAERAVVANGPKCPECKQLVKACGGKHESIVVYPVKYPEFGPWFRGVGINGVWYLSSHPGQNIVVPACAVGDIQQTVLQYEENERETRMGRTAEFNSGTQKNPQHAGASAGWR